MYRKSAQGGQLDMEDVSLTYTGILKNGKDKIVRVRFTRNGEKDFAEGVIPGGKIEKSCGFSDQELASLQFYLKANTRQIFEKAKEITGLRGFLR
ncbi:MAG: hypothetical protein HFH35_03865 [Eubacterium sp.]|nr:hypothetical protein [Eubacterium sp.]